MTDAPARLYGLVDRGRLVEGAHADIVVIDPEQVGPEPVVSRVDLPAGGWRLYGGATGIDHVLVNGVEVVTDGVIGDARPGTVLRSGRDTVAVERGVVIVSVDDHLVEPAHLFEGRMPAALADAAPRVEVADDGTEAWLFDGRRHPQIGLNAVVGRPKDEWSMEPANFDDMRRGCWDPDGPPGRHGRRRRVGVAALPVAHRRVLRVELLPLLRP